MTSVPAEQTTVAALSPGEHVDLTFSEVMSGRFSLGQQQPELGGAGTDPAGTLVLHATLTIPDVSRFLLDPEHRGTLDGSITFDPIGRDMPAVAGWFKLFAPSGHFDLKLMVYRMTIRRGTSTYTLHGEKHVRRGSVLRAWPETTTLRCRLHSGEDDTAPVCGAGILRISITGFARQLLSFRTPGGVTVARARALAGFVTFFARQIIETYIVPVRRARTPR